MVLESCREITGAHAKEAVASVAALRAFLAHLETIARPNAEAANVFLVIARLAGASWIEGTLRVELRPEDAGLTLVLADDLGGGLRERIAPPVRLAVPFSELAAALDVAPERVLPLGIREEAGGVLVLTPLLEPDPLLEEGAGLRDLEIAPEPRDSERPTSPPADAMSIPAEAIPPVSEHSRPTKPVPPDAERLDSLRPRDPRREDDD